ncbi:MAG TPA: transcriptional repressor, partial [bacterium]|nr:transcriptional repressor [bacterium]
MKSASSKQEDEIRRALAGRGIPFTTRRAEILNFFANSPRGRTISEVASAMSNNGIGQATVYRAVSLFLDRGLLCRINNGAGKTRLAAVHSGHAHPVVCSKCNKATRVRMKADGEGKFSRTCAKC